MRVQDADAAAASAGIRLTNLAAYSPAAGAPEQPDRGLIVGTVIALAIAAAIG